jgi:hypothetical protein
MPLFAASNSTGDQLINLRLRATIRRASKLRIASHFLQMATVCARLLSHIHPAPTYQGEIDPAAPLHMGEATLKPLLCEWVISYMTRPQLTAEIVKSWQMVMRAAVVPGDAAPVVAPVVDIEDTDSDCDSVVEVQLDAALNPAQASFSPMADPPPRGGGD